MRVQGQGPQSKERATTKEGGHTGLGLRALSHTSGLDSASGPRDFHCGSAGKESACNAGDLCSILGLGRSPGEGKGCPLLYSSLENSMHRGAWWATVHGVIKSQTRLSNFHSLDQARASRPSAGQGAEQEGMVSLPCVQGAPWGGRGGPPGNPEGRRGLSDHYDAPEERGARTRLLWGRHVRRPGLLGVLSYVAGLCPLEPGTPSPHEKCPQTLPVSPCADPSDRRTHFAAKPGWAAGTVAACFQKHPPMGCVTAC